MGQVASKFLIYISGKWLTILTAAGLAKITVALGIARKEAVMVISRTPLMENAASIMITCRARQSLGFAARRMAGKLTFIEVPTEDLANGHSCGNSSKFCGTGCQSGRCFAFSSALSSTTKPTSTPNPFYYAARHGVTQHYPCSMAIFCLPLPIWMPFKGSSTSHTLLLFGP